MKSLSLNILHDEVTRCLKKIVFAVAMGVSLGLVCGAVAEVLR